MPALKNIDQKNTFHQLLPGVIAIAHRGPSTGFSRNGRDRRSLGGRLRFRFGCPGSGIPGWNDQGPPRCSGAQDTAIPRQVSARRRHQDRQFGDEVLTLENNSRGSVVPCTFETVVEPAIGEL